MNYKRMIPNLVAWTTRAGDDFTELREVYEESIGRWFGNMQHITTVVGGVEVDLRSAEQSGAVYRVIPKARQQEALAFLAEQVFASPAWLAPREITTRIGPTNLDCTTPSGHRYHAPVAGTSGAYGGIGGIRCGSSLSAGGVHE